MSCYKENNNLEFNMLILFFILIFSVSFVNAEDQKTHILQKKIETRLQKGIVDNVTVELMVRLTKIYTRVDFNKAVEWGLKSLEYGEKIGPSAELAGAHNQVGVIFRKKSLYLLALNHLSKSAEIFEEIGDKNQSAWNMISIGNLYFQQEIYDLAEEWYQKAARQFSELNDENGKALSLNNLAMIQEKRNEFSKALNLYKEAVELRRTNSPSFELAYSLNQLGRGYMALEQMDSAKVNIEKGLEMAELMNSTDNISKSYQNLGELFERTGNIKKSIQYYEKSIEWEDESQLSKLYLRIAELFFLDNRPNKAIKVALISVKLAHQFNLVVEEANAQKLLSGIYEKLGNSMDALSALNRYFELKESINQSDVTKAITRIELSKEVEKRKIAIALKEKELSRKRLERNTAVVIAALFFIIGWGFVHRYFYIKKTSGKIQNQQEKIHRQEQEKITAELAHKKRELTSKALSMVQEKEFMVNIMEELWNLQDKNGEDESLSSIVSHIDRHLKRKNEWKEFELWFEQVHEGFFKNLSDKFPNLTPGERKLCAFLKLNLRSKEIASLTNLSAGTIDEYRRRLRKKINLPSKVNLVSYISKF